MAVFSIFSTHKVLLHVRTTYKGRRTQKGPPRGCNDSDMYFFLEGVDTERSEVCPKLIIKRSTVCK